LYELISNVLCLQFHETFATHFSPHQFGVATKGGCEIVIHSIMCILDLRFDWVVLQFDMANAFNLVSRGVILQKLCALGGNII
jgi:hypothetical protein